MTPDGGQAGRATDVVLTETFPVGNRACTLSLPLGGPRHGYMAAEWLPDRPTVLTPDERVEYARGRQRLLQRAADLLGGHVLVLE